MGCYQQSESCNAGILWERYMRLGSVWRRGRESTGSGPLPAARLGGRASRDLDWVDGQGGSVGLLDGRYRIPYGISQPYALLLWGNVASAEDSSGRAILGTRSPAGGSTG